MIIVSYYIFLIYADLLQPSTPLSRSLALENGSTITFAVTVMETNINSENINYLRELNWYHNQNKINPLTTHKYSISSDNTSLTIISTSEEDVGEYSVQFDGFLVYPFDQECEKQTLDLLRNYPILAPTTFNITQKGYCKLHCIS